MGDPAPRGRLNCSSAARRSSATAHSQDSGASARDGGGRGGGGGDEICGGTAGCNGGGTGLNRGGAGTGRSGAWRKGGPARANARSDPRHCTHWQALSACVGVCRCTIGGLCNAGVVLQALGLSSFGLLNA